LNELPVIDPHQHFWDLERHVYPWLNGGLEVNFRYGDIAPLRRSYLPEDYFRDSANQNVVGSVHVEAEWNRADPVAETRWLHELADKWGRPNGIVGHAEFDREDIASVLAGHAQFPLSRGIRHKPAATASAVAFRPGMPGSMADPKWRAGYALLAKHGLHYELQTRYWHLGEAADLARDFPDIVMVVNHAGVPEDRSEAGLSAWRDGMARLAEQPNVHVKISGIGQANAAWTADANRDIVLDVIRLFGVGRCMFASNYPVDSLVAGFDTIYDGFKSIVADFDAADRRALFHDNALRVYRLKGVR
jgi:predicted TIM-barrel fold metal-dependent hydrolase